MSGYTHKIMMVNNMINPITGQSFNSGLGYHPHRMVGGGLDDLDKLNNDEIYDYVSSGQFENDLDIEAEEEENQYLLTTVARIINNIEHDQSLLNNPENVKKLWNDGDISVDGIKTLYRMALDKNGKLVGGEHGDFLEFIYQLLIVGNAFKHKSKNVCMYELLIEQYKHYLDAETEEKKTKYARKIYILYSILRDRAQALASEYNSALINAARSPLQQLFKAERITQTGKTAGTKKSSGALYKYGIDICDKNGDNCKNNYAKYIIISLILPFFGAGDAGKSTVRNVWFNIDENGEKIDIQYTPDITDTTDPLITALSVKPPSLSNIDMFRDYGHRLVNYQPVGNIKKSGTLRNQLFAYVNLPYFNSISEAYKDYYVKTTNAKNAIHNEEVTSGKKKYKNPKAAELRPVNIDKNNMLANMVPNGGGVKLEFNICGINNPFANAIFNITGSDIRMTSFELFQAHLFYNKDVKTLNIGGQYSMDCIDPKNRLVIECKDYGAINHLERLMFNLLIKSLWIESLSDEQLADYNNLGSKDKELEFYRNNLYFGVAITTNKFMHIDTIEDISNDAPVFFKIGNKNIERETDKTKLDFVKEYIKHVQGQKTKPIFNNEGKIKTIVETAKRPTMPYYKADFEDVWFKPTDDPYTYYILLSTAEGLLLYNYSEDAKNFITDNKIWNYYRLGKQALGKAIGAVIIPMDKFKIIDAKATLNNINGGSIQSNES